MVVQGGGGEGGGREEGEGDEGGEGGARVHAERDLRVVELVVLVRDRDGADQEDVSHGRDDADDEEGTQLEAAALQVGEHRAEDLEHDDDEQDTVDARGDRLRERRAVVQEVVDRVVERRDGYPDQDQRDTEVDGVFGQGETGEQPGGRLAPGDVRAGTGSRGRG